MKKKNSLTRRNLSWDAEINDLAEELVSTHGIKGGVSELARLLVLDCSKHPDKYADVLGAAKKSFRDMVKEIIEELEGKKTQTNQQIFGKK